ncbi:hypothetical protein K1719_035158 [Acacia pycnantha]|nr:hypothetical protein K1719_035158 [Acacia pycnantha]
MRSSVTTTAGQSHYHRRKPERRATTWRAGPEEYDSWIILFQSSSRTLLNHYRTEKATLTVPHLQPPAVEADQIEDRRFLELLISDHLVISFTASDCEGAGEMFQGIWQNFGWWNLNLHLLIWR